MSGEDIAVLEYVPDDFSEPRALAYIGGSRDDGFIDDHHEDSLNIRTCDLRIRYLDQTKDQNINELKEFITKLLGSEDVDFYSSAIEICCEGRDQLDGEEIEKKLRELVGLE